MPPRVPPRTPSPSDSRWTLGIWGIPLVGTLLVAFLIIATDIPLGITDEWVWNREPLAPDYWLSLPFPFIVIAISAALIWWGAQEIRAAKRRTIILLLTLSTLLSFAWLWAIQESAPGELRLSKGVFVLYYPGPSGYFTEARYHVDDLRGYLSRYTDKLHEGDVLHIGTHPPGLIVAYRLLMAARNAVPRLFNFLDDLQPLTFRQAGQVLIANSRLGPNTVTPADLSILWAATLLVQFVAAFTVVPLFFLIAEFFSRRTAWLLIQFWPFVPALSLFIPKSDAFFPCLSAAILALWICGWRRGSFFLCCCAGFVAWLGLFFSLAFLPVQFLAALMTLWCSSPFVVSESRTPLSMKRIATCGLAVVLGFWLPVLLLKLWSGLNLIEVWLLNYKNHAGFYRQYTRTYSQWLWYNPLELAVALGLPIFWLALRSIVSSLRSPRSPRFGIVLTVLLTWSILWLTGKNMGEAARLWLFLTPWWIWLAAEFFERTTDPRSDDPPASRFWWLWATQILACLVLAARVVGFDLAGG